MKAMKCNRQHARKSLLSHTVPDGVVLDRQHPWRQQLELLIKLYPACASGQLEAVMEDGCKRLVLQRPVPPAVFYAICYMLAHVRAERLVDVRSCACKLIA